MTLSDIIMVAAVLLAPLFAIQASEFLQRRRDRRERRVAVFRTLMATRASGLHPEHVQALNLIDVEFHGKDRRSRAVLEAWKEYLDHLGARQSSPDVWGPRREDLFVELLHTMAQHLGFDFDKTSIRRTSYFPTGIGNLEREQQIIRKGLADVFEGQKAFPIFAWVASAEQSGGNSVEHLPPPESED
jgi:hypothetical protein